VCDESLNSLKPSGRLMITGVTSWYQIPFNLSSLQGRPMTLLGSGAPSRRSFAAMMHMVHRGGLRGVVDRTFDMAQAGKAHEVTTGRDFFGKLVLRVP
jgi:NADPH:quinone reductase-like Zn-dependent oxidoreductase